MLHFIESTLREASRCCYYLWIVCNLGLAVAAVAVFHCRCDVVCIVDKERWMKEAGAVAFRCRCGEQRDVGGRKGGKRIKMKKEGGEEADPKIIKKKY